MRVHESKSRLQVATPDRRAAYVDSLLHKLCTEIGPHPSGTASFLQVVEIVADELAQVVPLVLRDRYLDFWQALPRPEIIHRGKRLAVEVAENCAGTDPGGFTGVVERIDGTARYGIRDIASGEIAACIAVSEDVHAERAFLVGEEVLSLPRFIVGINEVPYVELLVAQRAEVQALLRVVYAPEVPTYNVVGTLPGETDDEILVMAHADSIIMTEGANDNMATAIITLMLAHAFSGTTPHKTLTFAITGSEEYGLCGARHYARRRQIEGTAGRLQFIVNSDSLTYGPNLWASTDDAELMGLVRAIHADLDLGTEPIYQHAPCWMNDAAPFADINDRVRGINFNSRGYDTLAANHTPADDAANVPRDCAESAFLVLRELVERLQGV